MTDRKIEIYTWTNPVAPKQFYWSAAFQECDQDVEFAYGPTEHEAIIELVANYDLPKDMP